MTELELLRRKTEAHRGLPSPTMRRAIREAAGVSQEDVAKAFDPPIHRETVSRWERGERTPRGRLLIEYVEILETLQMPAAS